MLRSIHEVEHLVKTLVASWHLSTQLLNTRRWHRIRFESPVAITPIDEQTGEPTHETMLAVGKNISLGGLCFGHRFPLPHRNIAVSFLADDGQSIESVTMRLTWCRFTREGTYQSGGQFQSMISSSIDVPSEWENLPTA